MRPVGLLTICILSLLGCKKTEPDNPLLACRTSNGGTGIGPTTSRTVMFWCDQDFQCGPPQITSILNTETQGTSYSGTSSLSRYFSAQPACGTTGTATISISKGYEYEYTIACTGRQWKAKFTADCSDDCIVIQLK